MSWFQKLVPSRIRTDGNGRRRTVPEGVWTKCEQCAALLYRAELERNLMVCPRCEYHMKLTARARLESFLDEGERTEIGEHIEPQDLLKFKDSKKYKDRLSLAQRTTGEKDALVVMQGSVQGIPVVASAFDFAFLGGSMGSVVGERFVQGAKRCLELSIPLINFAASGGARMQEALFSLMQMAKTSAVLAQLAEQRIPYVSVLTNPTTGGVSASLAMLGDLNIGEPHALVGFAGPRVIEQTVRETLPEGFQRSEFLLEHGGIDLIIDRRELRPRIARILGMLTGRPPAVEPGLASVVSAQVEADQDAAD